MARVLVAGATGALGLELLSALTERGHQVHAMARRADDPRLAPHVEHLASVRVGDVRRPETLASVVDDAEIVVSTIGLTKATAGADWDDVDYRGNLALLSASAAAGARRFHFVSLANIEDRDGQKVPILRAKRRFEQALTEGPVAWSISRPSGFFWNYGVMLTMARKGAIWLAGDGQARSTPVHEADLAAAISDRLELENEIFTVGGPQDFTYNEVASMIFKVLGKPENVRHLPAPLVRGAVAAIKPFSASKHGIAAFASWVMTHDATADHLGARRLEDWLHENRDRHFAML